MKRKSDTILSLMDCSIFTHGDGTFPLSGVDQTSFDLVLRLSDEFLPVVTDAFENALSSRKLKVKGRFSASITDRVLSGKLPFRPDLRVFAISAAFDCLRDIQRVVSERPEDTKPSSHGRHAISDAIRMKAHARISVGMISGDERAGYAMESQAGSDKHILSLYGWSIELRKSESKKEFEISKT